MYIQNDNIIDVLSVSRQKIKDNTNPEDVIKFVPRRYIDFTHPQGAYMENVGKEVCMYLHLNNYKEGKASTKVTYFIGYCVDNISQRKINVMWFGQAYMRPVLYRMSGHNIHVCGTLNYNKEFGTFSLTNPKITSESKNEALKILPIYSSIKEQEYDNFREILLKYLDGYIFEEWIPEKIINECNLLSLKEAYQEIHFPTSLKKLKKALTCIDFEKLLKFSISLAKNDVENSSKTHFVPKNTKIAKEISASLPFELTDDQRNTINTIISNMKNGNCETALIQGDVGSGKTIVAIIIMAILASSGYQSVLIAPTAVLAEQHYLTIDKLLSKFNIKTALLTNAIKGKAKKELIEKINNGKIDIIIGTHSVLNDSIQYNNLSLIITDEEHKFGVSQREKLRNKAKENIHSISMSATPIPRTLASTIYGNSVNVYTIKQKPNGRLPICTSIENDYNKAFDFFYQEIKKGHQCYVVCPKIDVSDKKENVLSVTQLEKKIHDYFNKIDSKISIASLTGKTSAENKSRILENFSNNKIQILVSTTVIEVGINVPNATVIAISNAEQFGLASLHQLRGRVGRSNIQSYCILISEKEDNMRLSALTSTNDGFEIAKLDLQQRGTGDLAGVAQSGFTEEMAILLSNPKMFEYTQKYAKEIVDNAKIFLSKKGILE